MKTSLFLISILFGGSLFAQTAAQADLSNSLLKKFNEEAKQKTESPSISFMENKGQIHDQNYNPRPDVLFGAMAGNMSFHLKTTGVSYQLTRVDSYKEVEDPKTNQMRKEIDQQTIYRVDLSWLNANSNLRTTTDQTLEGYNNYYLESCPEGALNVKSFTGVTVHNLYNGINLHYYEKEGQLKHDYIVAPGANYQQIQLKVEGATARINEDGSLTFNTPLGKIQEGAPIVYQNGKQLKAKWIIKTDGERSRTISFEIENYNPNQELIIDPVTRAWGTYYGASGNENGNSCATDATGNVYLAGQTTTTSLVIATAGAHQTINGGSIDAFIVKFNSTGVRQWGTYYGGTANEIGLSCAADAIGNVYLAGHTVSLTAIATAGAHQTVLGGSSDAFLVQFNSTGARQWGTYYGGTGNDYGSSIAIDATDNVYLAGRTDTNTGTIIATTGAHQTVQNGGVGTNFDAFLVKFNINGIRQWGTYYGGTGSDNGYSCSTDDTDNVYLVGSSTSSSGTAIATVGSHQTAYGWGSGDAFLVKFNSDGVRQWGTYYGGDAIDIGYFCTTDAADNVYMAGYTSSSFGTVIATTGAHQTTNGGGANDAFLVKFNSGGVRQWGTYYGGIGGEQGTSCTTDTTGNVYMVGFTSSSTGAAIATAGAHQAVYGANIDAFLVQFDTDGVRLEGTYYGGAGGDKAWCIASDTSGNIYFAGETTSNSGTVISTSGAHQTINGGGSNDAFLVKFIDACSGPSSATINENACDSYTWALNGMTYTSSGTYTHVGTNGAGCPFTTTLNLTINSSTTASVTETACVSYTWALNGTTYTSSGAYTHVGTNASGCQLTTTLNLTINSVNVSVVVADPTITANASGASYQWINCNNGNAVIPGATAQAYTATANGNYAVIVTNANCTDTSACQMISSVGIDEIGTSNIEVYPNPTSGSVNIILGKEYQNASVRLINALGQAILHKTYTSTDEITFEIEGESGVYFIEIETTEQVLGRIRVIKN